MRIFAKISLPSFGGSVNQIALMYRILVDESRCLHALSYFVLLHDPETMQLATYSDWLLPCIKCVGGVIVLLLFALFVAFVITAISVIYLTVGNVIPVQAAVVRAQGSGVRRCTLGS